MDLACSSNGANTPHTHLQRAQTINDYVMTALPASSLPQSLPPSVHLPPTLEQLASRLAVNSGSGGAKKKGKKGRITARFFNPVGPRPWMKFTTPLQSISATLLVSGTLLTTSTTLPLGGSIIATLGMFPSYTEYTDLFDQYRFEQIEVLIEPRAAQGTTVFAQLTTAVDLDDGNVPTLASQVQLKQLALDGADGSGRYHLWQPHMAVATFSGAFTSYANEPAGWIDSASPNVQHFGLKAYAFPTPVAISYLYTLRAKITFRGPGI